MNKTLWLDWEDRTMKGTLQKVIFFVLSMMLLFLIYRCSMMMKNSNSPYLNFPNKIETFR